MKKNKIIIISVLIFTTILLIFIASLYYKKSKLGIDAILVNDASKEDSVTNPNEQSSGEKTAINEYFLKDKINIYFNDNNSYPPEYQIIEGADFDTFEAIDGRYGKDRYSVYYGNKKLNADVETFKQLVAENYNCSNLYYADENNVYIFGKIISSDLNSFKCLGDGWAGDKNSRYFFDQPASYLYDSKLLYFENIENPKERGLGRTDTSAFLMDRNTGKVQKIFDFGKSSPGGENMPAILETNFPGILDISLGAGDGCGFYSETYKVNLISGEVIETDLRGGCGLNSNEIIINGTLIDELVDSDGCDKCVDATSCSNIKPVLKGVIIDGAKYNLFNNDVEIKCSFLDFASYNLDIMPVGPNKDFSIVYFKMITFKDDLSDINDYQGLYKLAYLVKEKKVVIVDDYTDLITPRYSN